MTNLEPVVDKYGEWCADCGRRVGVACNCGMTFAEKMQGLQIDRHSLKQREDRLRDPKNRGRNYSAK